MMCNPNLGWDGISYTDNPRKNYYEIPKQYRVFAV